MREWEKMLRRCLPPALGAFWGLLVVIGISGSGQQPDPVIWPERPIVETAVAMETTAEVPTEVPEETETASEAEETEAGIYTDGTYEGTGTGYGGNVRVRVTVENGRITDIQILSHQDTASYFNIAKDKIIASILKEQSYTVDAVSGATYSSRGIKEAVQNALTGEKTQSTTAAAATKKRKVKNSTYQGKNWKDGTYTGSAAGYGGTIRVRVVIQGGKIASVEVTDHSSETPTYYKKAKAITETIVAKQTPNVDTISGATYSSAGIREAVKKALTKAEKGEEEESSQPESETESESESEFESESESESESGSGSETESESESESESTPGPKDGSYAVTAKVDPNAADKSSLNGQFAGYRISGTVTFANGVLAGISGIRVIYSDEIDEEYEDDEYYTGRAASGMVSRLKKANSTDVDVVSGATCSSKAIIRLYRAAYEKATDGE